MPPSISVLAQLLLAKVQLTAARHKKKLVLALVLVLAGYLAKKRLTIAHVLSVVEVLTRAVQALPLPDAPQLRTLAEYEHPNTVPLKGLLEAVKLDELKRKIAGKEAGWEELKQAIVTCAALTVVLYNANSLHFLLQNKYREEFMSLNASTQFEQAMYELRKGFTEEVPLIFANTRQLLATEFARLELARSYEAEELEEVFERLVGKILECRFDLDREPHYTCLGRMSKQSVNLFRSPYEYFEEQSSVLSRLGGWLFRGVGGMLNVGGLLPTPHFQITSQRYTLAKTAYVQPLRKAIAMVEASGIDWPDQQSRELFSLVAEEIQFSLTSLNFSTLLRAYSRYSLKVLTNRVRLLMKNKQRQSLKFSEFLPLLNKILQEEFFRPSLTEHRDKYHRHELKRALHIASQPAEEAEEAGLSGSQRTVSLEEQVLEEIELKEGFQFLEKEMELKFYNERSGVVMRPKSGNGSSPGKAEPGADEMQKLLSMMGQSEVLNDQG